MVNKLSKELGLPEEVIVNTYKSYWLAIKELVEQIPLKEDYSQEEFSRLRTCFNIPSLGKLYCTYDDYVRAKNKYNYKSRRNESKKDKTTI